MSARGRRKRLAREVAALGDRAEDLLGHVLLRNDRRFVPPLAQALRGRGSDGGELLGGRERLRLPLREPVEECLDTVDAREHHPVVGRDASDGLVEGAKVGRRLDLDRRRLDDRGPEPAKGVRQRPRLSARAGDENGAPSQGKRFRHAAPPDLPTGPRGRMIAAAPSTSIDSASSSPRSSAREASPSIPRRRYRLPSTAPT